MVTPQAPLNDGELRKQEALILQSIDSEISKDSISESVLDSLEQLELVYRQQNIPITDWMKDAYLAAALHCSLRYLPDNFHRENGGGGEAVSSVLDVRVSKLELLNSRLLTEALRDCQKGFRVLLSNLNALKDWKEKSAEHKDYALTLTRFFVSGAMSAVEREIVENSGIKEAKDDEIGVEIQQTMEKAETEVEFIQGDAEAKNESGSNEKEANTDGKDKHMEESQFHGVDCEHFEDAGAKGREKRGKRLFNKPATPLRRHKGQARIVDSDDLDSEIVPSVICTSEANQSSPEIPLNKSKSCDLKQSALSNPSIEESLEVHLDSTEGSDARQGPVDAVGNPSVDESLDTHLDRSKGSNVEEASNSLVDESLEIRLDSPKRIDVSPLKVYEEAKFTKRRRNKIWTPEEEDVLRLGVMKYGEGNWKTILDANRDVFSERLEVDLKDKWRNLNKWLKMSRKR